MGDEHRAGPFDATAFPARSRIREATMALVVERGLDATTVESVLERAGVERGDFERDFADLRDCCLQIYRANIAEFDRVVFAVADPELEWRDRLRAVAYAAARYIRGRPLETRFDVIHMLGAGEVAQAHRDRYVERIVDLIDEGRAEAGAPESLTRSVAIGVVGSIYEYLQKELHGGDGVLSAEDFVPEMMYIAVRPYLGHDVAREELSIPPPEPSLTGSGGGE